MYPKLVYILYQDVKMDYNRMQSMRYAYDVMVYHMQRFLGKTYNAGADTQVQTSFKNVSLVWQCLFCRNRLLHTVEVLP